MNNHLVGTSILLVKIGLLLLVEGIMMRMANHLQITMKAVLLKKTLVGILTEDGRNIHMKTFMFLLLAVILRNIPMLMPQNLIKITPMKIYRILMRGKLASKLVHGFYRLLKMNFHRSLIQCLGSLQVCFSIFNLIY